jgi:hypothetical protein
MLTVGIPAVGILEKKEKKVLDSDLYPGFNLFCLFRGDIKRAKIKLLEKLLLFYKPFSAK